MHTSVSTISEMSIVNCVYYCLCSAWYSGIYSCQRVHSCRHQSIQSAHWIYRPTTGITLC